MKNKTKRVSAKPKQHRLSGCNHRQPANDEMIARAYVHFYQVVMGRMPSLAGKVPAVCGNLSG